MNIYVRDVIEKCGGRLVQGGSNLSLKSFCKDTREIKEGDVYLGIKGEVFDGNTFYKEAFDKGASVCILDKLEEEVDIKYKDKTIIVVDDTIKCIQELARYKRSLYDIPVIAITGSVGKTSTKDMIYSVVSEKYKTLKTMGNYNNHIGVPLTILSLDDEEALIVEMGMNHKGELSVLTSIAKPTMAVITNIGTSHIGNLGSRENILRAKLEILEGLTEDGILFINNDNDLLHLECDKLEDKYEVVTIGIDNDSDYKASSIVDNVFDSRFNIEGKVNNVSVYVGGVPFIYNALMAYAIGDKLGIDKSSIKKGISKFKLSSHRLEKKVNKRGTMVIDDTYNASFDSMKSSIEMLGKVKDKRRIAILGDMLELGEYSREIHTDIGEVICDNKIDVLITIGKYSNYIADRAIELGFIQDYIYGFDKEDECYDLLEALLTDKDIVLVKGSHGIHLVNVVNKIMEME
jgi:UDP-N-acetylmuramoyl-tripeptide--D-alanyl-D-alanine ligase